MAPRVFLVLVDDSKEMNIALRYASARAKAVGGHVALLYVMEPRGIQLWQAVEEQLINANRRMAEERLLQMAEMVHTYSGRMAVYYLREGATKQELLKLMETDSSLSLLVLGASKSEHGPGPIINYLSGRGARHLTMPLLIVPEDYENFEVGREE